MNKPRLGCRMMRDQVDWSRGRPAVQDRLQKCESTVTITIATRQTPL